MNSYRSRSLLGVIIPRELYYKEFTTQEAHDHQIPITAKFCPECGMRISNIITNLPRIPDEEFWDRSDGNNIDFQEVRNNIFIGFFKDTLDSNSNSYTFISFDPLGIAHLRNILTNFLLKYDLDKYISTFGYYSVIDL